MWQLRHGSRLDKYEAWARDDRIVALSVRDQIRAKHGSDHAAAEAEIAASKYSDSALERRIPAALRERVSPDPRWFQAWEGYWDLEGDRSVIVLPMGGSIPGAIPYTAASCWFTERRIEPDSPEWHLCRNAWRAMDQARAKHDASRREADELAQKAKAKS